MDLDQLALQRVMSIPPYPPGRPIGAVARAFGLDPDTIVKLASNENPLGPGPLARQAIIDSAAGAALYPDFDTFALRESLSAHLGVSPDRIMPGGGSSDHIVLAARAFLEPGRSGLISQYSFASYQGAISAVGARTIVAPMRDHAVDLDRMLAAIDETVKVIYLATPNNPTGGAIGNAALDAFLDATPSNVVVVLDEAYREYLAPNARPATDRLPEARPNVIVLRTFSKIYGLAGVRVGYALADPRMIAILRRLQTPFSVSATAEAAAVAALAEPAFTDAVRRSNEIERTRLAAGIQALGISQLPSSANFIMLQVGDGQAMFQSLMRRGVIVRPLDNYGLADWVRVSVGRPSENDIFLEHFAEVLQQARLSGASSLLRA